ncbi:MAG: 2-hydroxymuconate tautomerase family protein [Pseudomonadota bacterium]
MPMIRVEMFGGKSRETKRALAQELTKAMVNTVGSNPEAVWVVIKEVDKEDWAFGGELGVDKFPD